MQIAGLDIASSLMYGLPIFSKGGCVRLEIVAKI